MAFDLKRQGILFSLIGPSGSGKSSLGAKLLEEFSTNFSLSISVTSRVPREGELDGEHYYFTSRKDFEKRIAENEFFEWEETHGNYYGTIQTTLDEAVQNGQDLLLDVDIRGALTFKEKYPFNAISVFIFPPSFQELKNRIRSRGKITETDLERRLDSMENEYKLFLSSVHTDVNIDYFIINEDFDRSLECLKGIYLSEIQKCILYNSSQLEPFCQVKK